MTAASPLSVHAPALPDDRLKDLDALGFVDAFDPAERRLWIDWARALRLADQIAEAGSGGYGHIAALEDAVRKLRLVPGSRRYAAWSGYLDALATYGVGYVVRTLAEHDEMLMRLSGPLLQLAPHMPEELCGAAAAFGALDQAWNNVRDLREDAERGLCWFPEDVLQRHCISRDDVVAGCAPDRPLWRSLMDWWLGSYLPMLRDRAHLFLWATDIHPSLLAMREWTLRRYERIERAFRTEVYDYVRFTTRYW